MAATIRPAKSPPFEFWPIADRPPYQLPNDERIAFYVGLNVEYFPIDKPGVSLYPGTANLVPDPYNYGWRDYGARVGIWRILDMLDRLSIRPTVMLNADVCANYPKIIEACSERHCTWVAHGVNNASSHAGFPSEAMEREVLHRIFEEIERGTGIRPRGWLGPHLTESFATPDLLSELGAFYVLDWCNDDQPYPLAVGGDRMISVPYALTLNDIPAFMVNGKTGAEFARMAIDTMDQLYKEGLKSARVLALAIHPFISGQPAYLRYLEEIISYIVQHNDVWVTTTDEIAEHYIENHFDEAVTVIATASSATRG